MCHLSFGSGVQAMFFEFTPRLREHRRMKPLVKFLAFWCFFLTLVLADDQFHAEGTFFADALTPTPTPVSFNLSWNEENGSIKGTYQDNYFADPTNVIGTVGPQGRNFVIPFNRPSAQGVQSITIETSQIGAPSGPIPMHLTTRDFGGAAMESANLAVIITTKLAASLGQPPCLSNLGPLSGYCGLYAGSVVENYDSANRCNPVMTTDIRLELSPKKSMAFYLNYNGSLIGLPEHHLGFLPLTLLNRSINLIARHCGPLPGTTFDIQNCQSLNLIGTFSDFVGSKIFSGVYTITDENTHDTCSFNLSLTRDDSR
jgi:hypothetical protein